MEQIDKLIPANFRELFSFFAFVIGLIFTFISLNRKMLEHSLRMASILFVVTISLFANNGYCHFAAVFIIATAVTQLDFLQNLAAIIRGSKEYFDYIKGTKPSKEVEKELEKEDKVIAETKVEDEIKKYEKDNSKLSIVLDKQNLNPGQFGMLVEEYSFKYLEKKFGKPIQRYVRIQAKKYIGDFDGVMQVGDTDIIFELKTTRRGIYPLSFLTETLNKMIFKVEEYKKTTKRNAALRLILVGNFENEFKNKVLTRIPELISNEVGIEITIEFLSFAEIELEIDNIN
jgi:hypothetical protein